MNISTSQRENDIFKPTLDERREVPPMQSKICVLQKPEASQEVEPTSDKNSRSGGSRNHYCPGMGSVAKRRADSVASSGQRERPS
jgi:hypothetical protein